MSPMLCSQGMALATAMAVSGTVILLAFRLQKSLPATSLFPIDQIPQSSQKVLRPCISSVGKKKRNNKRVHFAEDVVDPRGDGEEFRRQHEAIVVGNNSSSSSSKYKKSNITATGKESRMPANRVALYNGILRDRVVHRLACSY